MSIYEIQFTTDPAGDSPYNGQIVDCRGGIVTHKYPGTRPKLTLYDPCHPTGWGGIQVKDWISPFNMFNTAEVGDRISLKNVLVEEFVGNTILQYQSAYQPSFSIISHDNPLPEPIVVEPNAITSPIEGPPWEWHVVDHRAEQYEHMWLRVDKLVVTRMDLGKEGDNYVLQSFVYPSDPNMSCWAADYMNIDKVGFYHPEVITGRQFCSVTGILEQYTNLTNGWDYYQLLTTSTEDFFISQEADFDEDCDVNITDFSLFSEHWLESGCSDPCWCFGMDMNQNSTVDMPDMTTLAENWLVGR